MMDHSIPLEAASMVSLDAVLDAHEVAVRARVDGLREEAARVTAALGEAETALEHMEITRATLATALAGHRGKEVPRDPVVSMASSGNDGALPPTHVPVWRAGLGQDALPVGYRRLWQVLCVSARSVRLRELTEPLDLEATASKIEGLRSKLKRLKARGWVVEESAGWFRAIAPAG